MTKHTEPPAPQPNPNVRGADLPGVGRQAIEDNPLTADEIEMFEMFEREGWSHMRRRQFIMMRIYRANQAGR